MLKQNLEENISFYTIYRISQAIILKYLFWVASWRCPVRMSPWGACWAEWDRKLKGKTFRFDLEPPPTAYGLPLSLPGAISQSET